MSKRNLGTILRVGVLACAALITSSSPAMGQAGKLDPTFATGGVFTSAVGEFNNTGTFGNVVAIQSDGKIVVGGQIGSGSGVLRLHANGTLDSSFGTGGIVTINFPGSNDGPSQVIGVAIQTDGKIVAGISNLDQDASPIFIVARLDANGSLDTTFGSGGVVETTIGPLGTAANVLALQRDGRILLAGGGAMARYDTNGQLDDTFGSGGVAAIQLGSPTAIALQPDGKILLAAGGAVAVSPPGVSLGLAGVIARYDANGSIDASFGIGGLSASLAAASAVAVETSGGCVSTCKIVVAGSVTNNVSTGNLTISGVFGLVRFTSTGSLDTSFGEGGGVTTSFTPAEPHATPYAVAVQSNGDIVVAGTAGQFATNPVFVQPAAFALARYTVSGALDSTFGLGGKVITAFGSNQAGIYALSLQKNGEIVAAGSSLENAVAPGAQTGGLVVARYLAQ